MSKFDLKIGKKYQVNGFSKPVVLHSFRKSDNTAKVIVDDKIESISLDDILGPVIDSLISLLGRWIKSLFTK